jgi:mono/diheme cytochrome c family protein
LKTLSIASFVLGSLTSVLADNKEAVEAGRKDFQETCAVCHGTDGTGAGPMAEALTKTPTDLTQLAKKNEGKFPLTEVTEIIDGRVELISHGTRDMPIWGERFRENVDPAVARSRILNLTLYLQSIQKK